VNRALVLLSIPLTHSTKHSTKPQIDALLSFLLNRADKGYFSLETFYLLGNVIRENTSIIAGADAL